MKFDEVAQLKPKKFTEECVLISVYFTLNRIKGDWFLNYISAPGGAWQELKILKNKIEHRFYIGKNEKRADLIMQKENKTSLFYVAEAKEFFRQILNEREKIDNSIKSIFNRIKRLKGNKISPIYSYIIGIDTTNLKGDVLNRVISNEINLVESIIDTLPHVEGGRVCILTYWQDNQTKFNLIFSKDFPKGLSEIFKKIFL
ncbi:MAG: hypothetical protein PHO28_01570 [Candidatus Pacebacteria bacterium]|nr:hypothetical protein [Candidatus Paceibacterota bacterium]